MTKTINDLYMDLLRRFKAADLPQPELEARELTAAATGTDKRRTANWGYLYLTEETLAKADALALRHLAGEPLAYILGEWDFCGLTLKIDSSVLIPRSDTERLCELAVHCVKQVVYPRVLDLCCGSGCIGIALLTMDDNVRVTAVDNSVDALAIARENAVRNNVGGRYNAIEGDVLAPPEENRLAQYHVLVCNPPYITAEEMRALDSSVRDYEPVAALYGGDDGLDFYRSVAHEWRRVTLPGAQALVECGYRQGTQVAAIFEEAGWLDIKLEEDYSGVPRYVTAMAPI